MTDAFRLVHLIRDVAAQEVAPMERAIGVGEVAAVEASKAALLIGANEEPTPGFTIPPHLAPVVGDLAQFYRLGGYQVITDVLNRNALTRPANEWPTTIRSHGAVVDGVTDDAPAIQRALDAVRDAGGGTVLHESGVAAISNTLLLRTGVVLVLGPNATLKWTGAAGGTMISNSTTTALMRSGLTGEGGILDPNGTAGYVFDLHSPQHCQVHGFDVAAGSATTTLMRIRTDATNAGYAGLKHAVWNQIGDINAYGPMGTFLILEGTSTAPVTLNSFWDLEGHDVRVKGISFVTDTDHNRFEGVVRFSMTASNGQGVVMNDSATPTTDVRVYANTFAMLAIDAFANGSTGRKGLVLNASRFTVIDWLFQEPRAEGGTVVDNTAISYYIKARTADPAASTNAIEIYSKNAQHIRSSIHARSDTATIPELISENIAASGTGQVSVKGRTAANVVTSGLFRATAGSVDLGSSSNNVVLLLQNGAEVGRLTAAGLAMASAKPLFLNGSAGPSLRAGTGTPEGVVTAPVGSLFMRTDGAAGSTLYIKEAGTAATGWRAV